MTHWINPIHYCSQIHFLLFYENYQNSNATPMDSSIFITACPQFSGTYTNSPGSCMHLVKTSWVFSTYRKMMRINKNNFVLNMIMKSGMHCWFKHGFLITFLKSLVFISKAIHQMFKSILKIYRLWSETNGYQGSI